MIYLRGGFGWLADVEDTLNLWRLYRLQTWWVGRGLPEVETDSDPEEQCPLDRTAPHCGGEADRVIFGVSIEVKVVTGEPIRSASTIANPRRNDFGYSRASENANEQRINHLTGWPPFGFATSISYSFQPSCIGRYYRRRERLQWVGSGRSAQLACLSHPDAKDSFPRVTT